MRGIHDRAVIERMRIGYAPGACLRGYLTRLGYSRQALRERGLVDSLGRDRFYRCLTFPLERGGNLYGRSVGAEALRVELPAGHDPASFFAAGAGAADFRRCLAHATAIDAVR